MMSQFTEPIFGPMTLQLVSETKVITITKHLFKCDVTFLKYESLNEGICKTKILAT